MKFVGYGGRCKWAGLVAIVFLFFWSLFAASSVFAQDQEDRPRVVIEYDGPVSRTQAILFSRDSQRLYAGGFGKIINFWDIGPERLQNDPQAPLTPLGVLRWEIARGNRGVINAMASHPKLDILAGGGYSARDSSGDIVLFDLKENRVITALPPQRDANNAPGHRTAIISLNFSPSGKLVSVSEDGEIWLWTMTPNDPAIWQPQPIRPALTVRFETQPAIFLDEETIAAAEPVHPLSNADWQITLYRTDGSRIGTLAEKLTPAQQQDLKLTQGRVSSLAKTPGGRYWVSAMSSQPLGGVPVGTILLWEKDQLVRTIRQSTRRPSGLAIHEDRLIAISNLLDDQSKSVVELYNVEDQKLDEVVASKLTECLTVAFSPDGKSLLTHNDDTHELLLYHLTNDLGQPIVQPLQLQPRRMRGRGNDITNVAFSHAKPASEIPIIGFSTSEDGEMERLFDLAIEDVKLIGPNDGKSIWQKRTASDWKLAYDQSPVVFSANQPAVQTLSLKKGDQDSGQIVLDALQQGVYRGVHAFLFDTNNEPYAVALATDTQHGIYIYTLPTAEKPPRLIRYYRDHSGEVTSLDVSDDGQLLVSAGRDQVIKIWSLRGLTQPESTFAPAPIWGADFAIQEGKLVVSHVDPAGIAYNRQLREGDQIARMVTFDREGQLVDHQNPQSILDLLNEELVMQSYLFEMNRTNPETNQVETLSTPVIVPGWEPVLTLYVDRFNEWVIFHPQGYFDASGLDGPSLFGWQINRGRNLSPRFEEAGHLQKIYERPDVIRSLLQNANIEAALTASNLPVPLDPTAQVVANIQTLPTIEFISPAQNAILDPTIMPQTVVTAEIDFAGAQPGDYNVEATHNLRVLPPPQVIPLAGKTRYNWFISAYEEINRFEVTLSQKNLPATDRLQTKTFRTVRGNNVDQSTDPGVVHVLSIASENYTPESGWDPLRFSEDDVERLSLRFLEQDLLRYRKPGLRIKLINNLVTQERISQALEKIREAVGEGNPLKDLVVIHISGHGIEYDKEFYYVPVRTSGQDKTTIRREAISWTPFCREVNQLNCNVLFLLDACHSGAAANSKAMLREFTNPTKRLIAACQASQQAAESVDYIFPDERELQRQDSIVRGHGLFTYTLVNGLNGQARPKSLQEAIVNDLELREYTSQEVLKLSPDNNQKPAFNPVISEIVMPLPLVKYRTP